MEKRKWLWKKKSSERSPGESESSGSFSSHSERYSDEQDAMRESPNDSAQSPEVTSKATGTEDEMKESVKCLTEKLSAALVNVSAKEDLVKQHAKVAEEAVAGWEKAEKEVETMKQQLEAAVQQNLNLEVRASHLDGALKECVRQLRQAKDEQEKRISDAIMDKNNEWELTKAEFEKRILDLKAQMEAARVENSASMNPNTLLIVEALERENSSLKQELAARCKELEITIIERDLSTQAAENASKLQLDSIKKVAKLEAECRRLQSVVRKSSPVNNQKSFSASSFYAESLTDSQSDSGERLHGSDIDSRKTFIVESNGLESSCPDSWASALIAELDQFKNEKTLPKKSTSCSVEIDMMDDFLEMERLAALPETKGTPRAASESASGESIDMVNPLRAELDIRIQRVSELEEKLGKVEAEKLELENALDQSQGNLRTAQTKISEANIKLEEIQESLTAAYKAKESLESQLIGVETEARTMSANVETLKAEIGKERILSAKLTAKCQELENELTRTIEETECHQNKNSNGELKVKQEDLAIAADKLAECQKTIESLGRQLKSLATLEDFLTDTSNIPGLSKGLSELQTSRISVENGFHPGNGRSDESPSPPSLTTPSADNVAAAKSRNGFGRFFSRSKSVAELANSPD